ncbi:MAG TPA: EcsC family protein [Armatimonadota bacterium]|nr:EcsC family protein [Armatimonadota bacterium]
MAKGSKASGNSKLEKAFEQLVDWAIKSAGDVEAYVDKLREQNPHLTDDQLARKIVSQKSMKSGFVGFATGLPGLTALPATVPIDVVATWKIQVTLALAIAYVYGHTGKTTDFKTDLSIIVMGDAAKEALKQFSIEASKAVTQRVVNKYVTREMMKQIWKVFGRKIITKAGEKSLTSFTKMVPGVGGLVGFAFDWAATKAFGQFAIKYYGPDTPLSPAADDEKTLATWSCRSIFSYSGSVEDGLAIYRGITRVKTTQIDKDVLKKISKELGKQTVSVGMSRGKAPEGSLDKWLVENDLRHPLASCVAPILVAEGYAERVGKRDLKVRKCKKKLKTKS